VTDSNGSLTGYVMAGFMPASGSQSSGAGVCALTDCTEPNVVRWGTWNNATATISGQPVTSTATNLLHYIVGSATTPTDFANLTGSASYAPVGGTIATDTSGRTYVSTFGNIAVNFSTSTATLASYSVSGASVSGAAGQFASVPLSITPNGNAVLLSGFASNAANNNLSVSGFFAGSGASHIGAAFKVNDSQNTININQVQAFKK
jgi:hypothetical protein